jgi:SHS2 domain-containing protein
VSRGHREIDHSGDVGVEAWGATRAALFEEATLGLYALMAPAPPPPVLERELAVTAADDAALLVDWLNEVILAGAVHGELYSAVRVEACDGRSARGVVSGTPTPEGAELRFDVKAATYHELRFERSGAGYRARVIFDL